LVVRKLYLVPIVHTSADMGCAAAALDERASAQLGREVWQEHKETVSGFWDSIAQFFESLDVNGFKVYQDGMVANGEAALRIIRNGVSRGSRNYEILGKLLKRGAVLMKTEDIALVKQEHTFITKMTRSSSRREKEAAALRYKLAQNRLLKQRDGFIARRVQETLGEKETGILFIGAYHDVLSKLPDDIKVIQVKDVARVREYHKTVATWNRDDQRFHELAEYLCAPVNNSPP
jgi:hypothetical protein